MGIEKKSEDSCPAYVVMRIFSIVFVCCVISFLKCIKMLDKF